jgi:hypothetical protein
MAASAPARMALPSNPFDLRDEEAYQRWREWKLNQAPASIDEIIIEVGDPLDLSASEHASLLAACVRSNMVIYAGREDAGVDAVRQIGRQFGLSHLDANWLADEDDISRITPSGDSTRQGYIPYTNRPIKWHTDGYYNPPERRICGMILHCVRSAAEGGENKLMDHEMAYLLMRDHAPEFICALSAPDAMTIPERTDDDGIARAAQTGPVFSVDAANGSLHMRYTARTRSIEWKQDAITLAAVSWLENLLNSDSPHIYRARLEPGMGLLCNNVLHDRSGFTDSPNHSRLLYRARYYDRITGT